MNIKGIAWQSLFCVLGQMLGARKRVAISQAI